MKVHYCIELHYIPIISQIPISTRKRLPPLMAPKFHLSIQVCLFSFHCLDIKLKHEGEVVSSDSQSWGTMMSYAQLSHSRVTAFSTHEKNQELDLHIPRYCMIHLLGFPVCKGNGACPLSQCSPAFLQYFPNLVLYDLSVKTAVKMLLHLLWIGRSTFWKICPLWLHSPPCITTSLS